MFAAYLLTEVNFPYVLPSIVIGAVVAGIVGFLVGLIALRRTGIYFAMITVAIAEVFFFIEFNPLSDFTGGENGLPGVPTPSVYLGFTTAAFQQRLVDLCLSRVLVLRWPRDRAAHRTLARRGDLERATRQSAAGDSRSVITFTAIS